MYDINVKNVKKGSEIFIIMLVVGLFLLVAFCGVFVSNRLTLNSLDSTIMSTKVEVKTYVNNEGTKMYSPVYYYTVDGNDYVCGSNFSSNINPGTANQTVYYDSKDPENCITEHSKSGDWWLIAFAVIPIIGIIVAVVNMREANKRAAKIKRLNQKGKLVKNLPYRLEDSGTFINGASIPCLVVDYTLPSGVTVTLYGNSRDDGKYSDEDGMVDLVIDEDDPENYFIDFEINRLSGNLPTDYYNNSGQQVSPQQPN